MHLDFLESAEFYNRRYHNFSSQTSIRQHSVRKCTKKYKMVKSLKKICGDILHFGIKTLMIWQ